MSSQTQFDPEESRRLHIEKRFGVIVFQFDVLYKGWELDDIGYVTRNSSGKTSLILSNHNSLYAAASSELESKISEYEEAIRNSREALRLLNA